MIYGSFFSASPTPDYELRSAILWSTAVNEQFTFGSFSGGIINDRALQTTFSDFIYSNDDSLLFFSGTIYNRHELAFSDLKPAQQLFELYCQNGNHFAATLNGDFAIVIYNKKEEEVLLYRDHVGMMPLAYASEREELLICSDILKLSALLHPKTEIIQLEALLDGIKVIDDSLTPNPKVKKLPPGHFLHYRKAKIEIVPYWFPEKIRQQKTISVKGAEKTLSTLIERAVKLRSDKNLQAAAHFSGGLDSSLITAFSKKHHPGQDTFYGFSWSPAILENQELEFDERARVSEGCAFLQIEPVFLHGKMEEWMQVPNPYFANTSSFEENQVLQEARKRGIQVLFSGWGGDDFASIDHRGVESDLFFLGKWLALLQNRRKKGLRKKLGRLLYSVIYPYFGVYKRSQQKYFRNNVRYLNTAFRYHDKRALGFTYHYKSRKERHLNALADGHLAARCENWYNIAIRMGVLYRYPLLDKDVIEYVLSLPSAVLYDQNVERSLFRRICSKYLPHSIVNHERKTDPALNAASEAFYQYCFSKFKTHFSSLKANPELICFNFDLLEQDLLRWEQGELELDLHESLFNTMFNLYQLSEFVAQYRKK